ncbi:SGNH/GDSL hydrolase family protein [Melittangium boletus]|uniref:SGNH/GDSL hydrolase family protein n=1 Tax=Melittangium boletus TaxID=83453 RepID=UPI003DA4472A
METPLVRVLMCLALLSPAALRAEETPPEAPVSRPRTVLLLGDSLIVTSFGEALEERLNGQPGVRAVRRAKSSTGLARPDFFDWMQVGREEVEKHQPDVVVVIMGGNDGQGLTDGQGKAMAQWGASHWTATYRQRVEDFLGVLEAPGRRVLWVALPITGLPRFERKLGIIRAVLREAVSARGGAVHLDTRPFFTDPRGTLLKEAPVDGFRKPMRLRMEDGVHFTLAGGRYFAGKVHPEVVRLLEAPAPAAPAEPEAPAVCREPEADLSLVPLVFTRP